VRWKVVACLFTGTMGCVATHMARSLGEALFFFLCIGLPSSMYLLALLLVWSATPKEERPKPNLPYIDGILSLAFRSPWVCASCGASNARSNTKCYNCGGLL
jgi:hypothetical protein